MSRIAVWNPWRALPRDMWDWDMDMGISTYDDTQMDIYETGNDVVVKLKAPGFRKEDLNIQIESNMITISGTMKQESEEEDKGKKYYRKEIRSASFSKTSELPVGVDADKSKATFKDGVLEIVLPKREEVKPKTIEVQVG